MAAIDIRTKDAATYFGAESTFGTLPSMTRIYPVTDSFELTAEQTEIDNDTESALLYDQKSTVRGLKSGQPKFAWYLRPDATQLTAGASPSTPWAFLPLKSIFGAEVVDEGSVIQTSSTTTSLILDTGDGGDHFSNLFPLLSDVGGVPEPTFPLSRSTDTLTLGLALSATPTQGEDVIQMYSYYPAATNTNSFSLQHAFAGNSVAQWSFKGCTGDLQIEFPRNGLIKASLDCMAADWVGPSDQSITTTVGSDPMDPPFAVSDGQVFLQATGTTTRTHYPLHSMSLKLNHGLEHIPQLAGGVNGNVGVMRTNQRLFAEITLQIRADNTADATWWANQTDLFLFVCIPKGSGATKRWLTVYCPKVEVVGKPKTIREGGRYLMELVLHTHVNTSSPLAGIPFVLSIG